MKQDVDLLDAVRAELHERHGSLRRLAAATEISYDTLLRVKNGEGNPSYAVVKRLADHLLRRHRQAA
jgi:transcriptional regulator with XRE-family HTH domain